MTTPNAPVVTSSAAADAPTQPAPLAGDPAPVHQVSVAQMLADLGWDKPAAPTQRRRPAWWPGRIRRPRPLGLYRVIDARQLPY